MDRHNDGTRLYLLYLYGKYVQMLMDRGVQLTKYKISSCEELSTMADQWVAKLEETCAGSDPKHKPGYYTPMQMHQFVSQALNEMYGEDVDKFNKERRRITDG